MEEIKFRAWDADAEFMLYSDKPEDEYFFEFDINGKFKAFVIRYDGFVGTVYEPPQPEVEELHDVMQYTGLKDKNGKEIYEGDIIKEGGRVSVIEWAISNARFCYKAESASVGLYGFYGEIIGNIYENPIKEG